MVKKKFNISNRSTYTLLSIAILILFATVVYAYNTDSPSFFGHSAGEVEGLYEGLYMGDNLQVEGDSGIKTFLIANKGSANSYMFGLGNNIYFDGSNWQTIATSSNNGASAVLGKYGPGQLNFYVVPSTGDGADQEISNSDFGDYLRMTIDEGGAVNVLGDLCLGGVCESEWPAGGSVGSDPVRLPGMLGNGFTYCETLTIDGTNFICTKPYVEWMDDSESDLVNRRRLAMTDTAKLAFCLSFGSNEVISVVNGPAEYTGRGDWDMGNRMWDVIPTGLVGGVRYLNSITCKLPTFVWPNI